MTNARKTLKVEILLTRKCQLKCSYCAIVDNNRAECSIEQWKVGLDNLKALGCTFATIYGGEPTLVMDKLCEFVVHCTKIGMAKTIITNAVSLSAIKLDRLIAAGLDSLTVSFDSKNGMGFSKSVDEKSILGLRLIEKAYEQKRFRDLEVIMCLHRLNYQTLPTVIRYFSDRGIWVMWDVVHWGRWPDSKCGDISTTDRLRFQPEDKDTFQEVMTEVLGLVRQGALVFNTEDTILDYINNYEMTTGLSWKCSYPGWLSVDCDGQMRVCDDRPGMNVGKFHVWELTLDRWEEYLAAWNKDAPECLGCYWSSLVMAERMYSKDGSDDFFAHRLTKWDNGK